MLFKLFFKQFSPARQIAYLRKKGTLIGSRKLGKNLVSVYLIHDFFVEVMVSPEGTFAESIKIFQNLKHLQHYMEHDTRLKMN